MFKHFIALFFFLISLSSTANPIDNDKIVTVISWWNYLDKEWIKKEVKETCRAKLAVQSYKDANEFSKSFELKYYDIAIYESSQFKDIENEIPSQTLMNNNKSYNIEVQNIYDNYIDKPNTAFFFLSNTVLLYDPQKINLTESDSFESIQTKLRNNLSEESPLIILDDPTIINAIINTETNTNLSSTFFSKVFSYKNIIISNDYIDYKNFGVFFTWSGEAFYHKDLAKKSGINLKIITIPRYSYITADLISLLSKSKEATCVANLFSGKKFLKRLQNETFYFSPFIDSSVVNKEHKKIYENFESTLKDNKNSWLLPTKNELKQTISAWEKVVLDYGL